MPTKSLGTLTLDLIAKIGGFEQGMDQAARISEKRLKQIATNASIVGNTIGNFLTKGINFAAKAFVDMFNKADELGNVSEKVGVAVEELSKLQYAAKINDVSAESLQDGLLKLSKSATAAADGTGDAAAAFAALGVTIKDAGGGLKSTDQLFLEVADSFSKFADGPEKAAAAMAIFGRSGADLIPVLNAGKAGIKEASDELERFGGVVTTEAAEAADAFNKNLDRLTTGFEAFFINLSGQLTPALSDFSGRLVKLAADSDAVGRAADGMKVIFRGLAGTVTVISNVFQIAGDNIGAVAAAFAAVARGDFSGAVEIMRARVDDLKIDLKDIVHAFDDNSDAAKAMGNAVKDGTNAAVKPTLQFSAALEDAANKSKKAKKEVDELAKAQAAALDSIQTLNQGLQQQLDTMDMTEAETIRYRIETGDLAKQFLEAGAAALPYKDSLIQITEELERRQKLSEDAKEQIAAEAEAMDEVRAIVEKTMPLSEKYSKIIERINELYAEGRLTAQQYAEAVNATQKEFEEASKAANKATDEMTEFAEQAARNMQDAFADFLFDPFDKGLKGMLQSFEETLRRMVANQAAAQILGSFKSQASGFDWGGLFGSVASFFGGLFGGSTAGTATVTSFPGRAIGGPVTAGMPYMVGERGPELFVPNISGQIDPGNWGKSKPSITVNVPIHAPRGTVSDKTRGQVASDVARELARWNARNN